MPRLPVEVVANAKKAREAAVLAVEIYNRPATSFRSAGYIVLMIIAWTALFHALFLRKRIKPYYRKKGSSRRYERIEGDYKT
jgi:ABC-type Fe3+ transport system permease subunit